MTWVVCVISMWGNRSFGVAYPLLALTVASSPVLGLGGVGFFLTVPMLLVYIPAGFIVDWFPRPRLIMIISALIRGFAALSVFVALAIGQLSMIHLMLAAFVEGSAWVIFAVTETTFIRSVAPAGGFIGAVAGSESAAHVAVLAGRPLGGLLFGLSPAFPFIFNAALFLMSILALLAIPDARRSAGPDPRPERAAELPNLMEPLKGIRQGFTELLRNRFLRQAMVVTTVTNLLVNTLIMIFLAGSGHWSPIEVGVVLGAGGLGGAVGSAMTSRLLTRYPLLRQRFILLIQVWMWVLALTLAAFGPQPYSFALATLLTGISGSMSNVAIRVEEVDNVSPDHIGRVIGVNRLVVHGVVCLAAPLAGLMISWLDAESATVVLAWLAAMFAGAATVYWWLRGREESHERAGSRRIAFVTSVAFGLGIPAEVILRIRSS